MHGALPRGLTLERGIQAAIVCTVVGAVLAAGSVLRLVTFGRTARWIGLAALAFLAVVWVLRQARPSAARPLLPIGFAAAAFLALAYASATWSATPGVTFAHATAFALVVTCAASIAAGAAGSSRAVDLVVDGLLYSLGVVAVGGLAVLLLARDRAIDPATELTAARYQGLGGGPNTATMVLALGTPLVVAAALGAATRRRRLAAGALVALIVGSIIASGSRGALLGAFGGLLVYVALRERTLSRRLVGGATAVVAFAAAAALMRLPDPLPAGATSRRGYVPPVEKSLFAPKPPYGDANLLLRLQDEVGHPPPGVGITERARNLLGSSGRVQAWEGALEQGAQRPFAGYGFGTEERVFADRYVSFNSSVPENSYVGLFLQLGAAGLVSFVALLAAMLVTFGRALAALGRDHRGQAAACLGAFIGGLILAVFQSFFYAAGNNATAVLWICGFLACAAAIPHADRSR